MLEVIPTPAVASTKAATPTVASPETTPIPEVPKIFWMFHSKGPNWRVMEDPKVMEDPVSEFYIAPALMIKFIKKSKEIMFGMMNALSLGLQKIDFEVSVETETGTRYRGSSNGIISHTEKGSVELIKKFEFGKINYGLFVQFANGTKQFRFLLVAISQDALSVPDKTSTDLDCPELIGEWTKKHPDASKIAFYL